MAHMCICPACGQKFDRDKIQAVKVGARRYGHASCYPDNKDFVPLEIKEEDKDLTALKDYISKKYGAKANWPLINKQIKDFQSKGFTLSGILKSLVWFYDVKRNSVENSNGGIGICEYCYQDAYNYYYSLFIAQSQNENKDFKSILNKVKEIVIPVPKVREEKRMFKLQDDEVDE